MTATPGLQEYSSIPSALWRRTIPLAAFGCSKLSNSFQEARLFYRPCWWKLFFNPHHPSRAVFNHFTNRNKLGSVAIIMSGLAFAFFWRCLGLLFFRFHLQLCPWYSATHMVPGTILYSHCFHFYIPIIKVVFGKLLYIHSCRCHLNL